MSLIIVARFRKGILLAADPFVFDNDGEVPCKAIDFDKFIVSKELGAALVAVGSRWVFAQFHEWIETGKDMNRENLVDAFSTKWAQLNQNWKKRREKEAAKSDAGTLRPISDSLFILVQLRDLSSIYIVDQEGNTHISRTYVLSGSGSSFVRHFLETEGKSFRCDDSLLQSSRLMRDCYGVAKQDLYVTGLPALVAATANGFFDFSRSCERVQKECEKKYFADLSRDLMDKLKESEAFSNTS